ncbi:MAG: D-aminoacyl-tRNA deacylase [Candidatus Omnitrophota bacterium]
MKILVVRINKGSISVEGKVVASVGKGIALFVGIEKDDTNEKFISIADKIINLRIFENDQGKMYYSVKDKNYQVLSIPNFTLCASTEKGRRPSFELSKDPGEAKKMFEDLNLIISSAGVSLEPGVFGAHMDIDLVLDGPVNIILNF